MAVAKIEIIIQSAITFQKKTIVFHSINPQNKDAICITIMCIFARHKTDGNNGFDAVQRTRRAD